jgi:hypothetical protein
VDGDEISYEQFGVNFVTKVVTPERVAATIGRVSGSTVSAGPMAAGPGGAASVTATGTIGDIEAQVSFRRELLGFDATIPIDLQLDVRVAGSNHRYIGDVTVSLRLGVRAVAPLSLMIDVDQVRPEDVRVSLKAGGVRAKFLQRLGGIDEEVRSTVATIVGQRLESPEARAVRELHILDFVDQAWNA